MARIRTIKPEFFFDEDLAKLPHKTRLLFIGLWTHCDKAGRCEDQPGKLRALIFPYESDLDVDEMLESLQPHFIVRYEAQARDFIQIRSWDKHQRPHVREPESTFPPLPKQCQGSVKALPRPLDKGKGNDTGYGILEKGKGMEKGNGLTGVDKPRAETPFQKFMNRILKDFCEIDMTDKGSVSAGYRRFGKAAKDILAFAKGDPEKAYAGVDAIADYMQSKGLTWTFDTAARWFPDWLNGGLGNAEKENSGQHSED